MPIEGGRFSYIHTMASHAVLRNLKKHFMYWFGEISRISEQNNKGCRMVCVTRTACINKGKTNT